MDGYAGKRVTAGEYLFRYHSIGEVIRGSARGFRNLYAGNYLQWNYNPKSKQNGLLLLAHSLGLLAMLWPKRRLLVLGAVLLFHAPLYFLCSFYWFDPRLVVTQFVANYMFIGAAAATAVWGVQRLLLFAGADGNASTGPPNHRARKESRKSSAPAAGRGSATAARAASQRSSKANPGVSSPRGVDATQDSEGMELPAVSAGSEPKSRSGVRKSGKRRR